MNVKRLFLGISFLCVGFLLPAAAQTSKFTDPRDGKEYRTVTIGEKTWMAENLNFEISKKSWCYGNSKSNCEEYGRLYQWRTAKNACPAGWGLPTRQDWDELVDAAGGRDAARNLKSTTGWDDLQDGSSGNGTDEFGFSALPSGRRWSGGASQFIGTAGYWWTASGQDPWRAWNRAIVGRLREVDESHYKKNEGFSVRCVKN